MYSKHHKKLLSLAVAETSDGIWTWHLPSGEAYFSPRYYTMLGYEPDELPANYETWSSLLHPEDREATQSTIKNLLQEKNDTYEVEFRLQTKPGDWLWILGRGRVVEWNEHRQPILVVGSHVNIDTRKRAEQHLSIYQEQLQQMVEERTEALEQTTSLLEATLNAIPDILGIQDDQHRIIRYNAAGYDFLEKTHEEVVGKRCFELIGRSAECVPCATSECYRTRKPASVIRYEESLDAWLDVRAYPILDENGKLVKVIEHLRDITPEKRAEDDRELLQQQLINAQKMESLGTLAGGIAHDFNNLLMGIQGQLSLMALDLKPFKSVAVQIDAIDEYIERAKDLTKQLLGFARGGKYEVKPLDLNQLISESAAMFGRTKKELEIVTETDVEPIVIEADRRQLEQVLLNLYINSWQAMPDGGTLELKTSRAQLSETEASLHQVASGPFGRISIKDNGAGMDEETQQRMFDPFFTTKETGRGTGLGLASAYGIIKNHNGFMDVESSPGAGTCFEVYLPISEQQVNGETLLEKELYRGQGKILLVDDEQMILDVGRSMIEKLGYQVTISKGGEKTLEWIKNMGNEFDLVILDMIMPGIDGEEVFDYIHAKWPDLPVLLSSGYTIEGKAESILNKGCNGFIQKPFTLTELSKQIHKVIAGSG
jgi:PAS domain S-box-containing protein